MTVELFQGTPEALQARLEALIALPKTIDKVIATTEKGRYIIMYS